MSTPGTILCAACGDETRGEVCSVCGADPRLDGRYWLSERLGQGSFGTTWRARCLDGTAVAIKETMVRLSNREGVERELRVLRSLEHPGIPRFLDAFQTRSGRFASQLLVQELIEGQTLEEEFAGPRYEPAEVVALVAELADVLAYLHGLSPPVIHRDVKPANIMRRLDGSLVLIDFGLVRDTVAGTLGGTREVGTLGYHAPEQFAGDPVPAPDVFSLGAVAVRLLTRRDPHTLAVGLYDRMKWRKYADVSGPVADLVHGLVEPELEQRTGDAAWVRDRARQLLADGLVGGSAPLEDTSDDDEPALFLVGSTWVDAPDMVRVEPGRFVMGSPEGEADRDEDEAQHPVRLTFAFEIARVPVTRALYAAVTGLRAVGRTGDQRPVVHINWFDAVGFCNQLSDLHDLQPAYTETKAGDWRWDPEASGFRLPTEAEWEYAARAGEEWSWAGANLPDAVAWHRGNADGRIHAVAKKRPNAWGLHDLSGNAWEWVWDRYGVYSRGETRDPAGPRGGEYRVIRGGCYEYAPPYARVARRGGRSPQRKLRNVGFRVVRTVG